MKKYLYKDLYLQEEKHWWHIAKRSWVKTMLRNYYNKTSGRILDVGCGTGENMKMLSAYGKVYGVDISKEAILFCKKRKLTNLFQENIEKTHFSNNFFDVVTALDVIEHVNDIKACEQIKRILKKDGIFVLTVPAFQFLWSEWDSVLDHKKRYTIDELKQLLSKQGFSILHISYIFSFLFLPVIFIRKIKSFMFKKTYSSDFSINNSLSNILLLHIALIEKFLAKYFPIPFGTTIICVVKKI